MQQLYHPMAYRNELYDRTAGYDVPRGRPAPNYYQNQPSGGTSNGRYPNLHLDLNRVRYPSGSTSQQQQQRTPRQRSFDDTESYHYYRCQNQSNGIAKYDNLYERVREEPAYQNTGSFAPAANRAAGLFGRFDVIGHGVGRIERHLSSSCGNIDHYSLGGHYAVLGHSHLGTMGHIRLNQTNSSGSNGVAGAANGPHCTNGTTVPQPNPTKDSSSVNVKSFFSCLGGENSQSMNNLNKSSTSNGTAVGGVSATNGNDSTLPVPGSAGSSSAGGGNGGGQGSSIMGGLASAAAVGVNGTGSGSTMGGKSTGAIPKISRKSKQSQQVPPDPVGNVPAPPSLVVGNGLPQSDVSLGTGDPTYSNACGGRVTKPSLQWLLVNKWLPLWVGQTPPDYKFIDFNFMFSRNCDGCASAGGSHGQQQQQQELVRYGTIDQADYIPPAREYPTMTGSYPRVLRNTPQLARLREHEYENVPLNDPPTRGTRGISALQPARARSESPSRSGADPLLRTWAFNFENNTFRPARSPALTTGSSSFTINRDKPRAVRRITDGTFGVRDIQQTDTEKPGPSGLAGKFVGMKQTEPDKEDGRLSSASSSSDSDNFAIESLAAESGGQPEEEEDEDGSTRSADIRPDGGPVGNSTEKEQVGSSSNDTSDSLNYDGPETADRSLSEDEVELAVVCAVNVDGSERPDPTVSE
ncbi:ring canal kelch homolog [Anopheles marshallii]|uniref:ring canal kelch homolog n=1 Tax=Anopheles marshallii TaxID=1521116 RepID=UPI00237B1300|nr:ring canal kelch homolog [Anopheles marshallii]